MTPFDAILGCLLLVASAHFVGIGVLLARARGRRPARPNKRPPITILRPAAGIENHVEETLASAFAVDYPEFEIVFCVQDPADPVIAVIGRLMEAHPAVPSRLLIGDDKISNNPKLNNLVKGWQAARHEWIVMADSNVQMPATYLNDLMARWADNVGLVSSPPAGTRPQGIGGRLECAFLNTYQARWQLIADAFGVGFAQGKTMLFRRDILERAGGISVLASATAEDIATTRVVRAAGLRVRLTTTPFPQPLGRRTLADVWRRQLRWSQLRRRDLGLVFLAEPLTFAVLMLAAAAVAIRVWELPVGLFPLLFVLWYGAEGLLARVFRWHLTIASPAFWIARDLLLPVLWLAALANRRYEWRGHEVDMPLTRQKTEAP